MRFTFSTLDRPKKAARRLHKLTEGIPLSRCQSAVAAACGYRDWHDLESHCLGTPNAADQDLSLAEWGDRCVFQSDAIAKNLEIYYGDAKWALPQLRLTGDWAWDEYLVQALPRARSGVSVVSREEFGRRPFAMAGFMLHELTQMKHEGPRSRRRAGAPDRLEGAFPFAEEARAYITKIVAEFEAEEGAPVLQAAWRFDGQEHILVRLEYGYVEEDRIIESDPIRLGPVRVDSLSWKPNSRVSIVPTSLSPSNFSGRPEIDAMLRRR